MFFFFTSVIILTLKLSGFTQLYFQNSSLLWIKLIVKGIVKDEHAVSYWRESINKNSSLSTFSRRKFEDIQALMSQTFIEY